MANIKISELNSLTDKAYDDLIPIVDSSANETKKISIDKLVDNNVELIAVSNDAPSECSTGDKYYNKTTNKIYTATGTNTWGTTGEDAIEGILYIVFEEQTTYAYDGETLVSVGGGAGTYVGDTPPEEPKENDLWVDTEDDEYLAQVDSTVSTTSTNAVQNQAITNYVNSIVESGSNTSGSWVKFNDGTMICYNTVSLNNIAVNTANGSLFVSGTHSLGNFPVSFVSKPNINLTVNADAYGWIAQHDQVTSSSVGRVTMYRSTSSSSSSYEIDYIAIGKWK